MSLSVCVSASSTDGALATVDDLRAVLGTTSTAAADVAAQQRAIVVASRWAETYLGYPVLAQVYSESLAGFGNPRLMLSRTPIRAVLRLFDSTSTDSANAYTSCQYGIEDAEAGFLRMPTGFAWTARTGWDLGPYVVPGSEQQRWLVEYQAGWVFGGTTSTAYGTTSTGPSLPDDITQGVLQRAAEFVEQDMDVESKRVGDLQVSYRSERGLPYRRLS
jgi:hypothetical protein